MNLKCTSDIFPNHQLSVSTTSTSVVQPLGNTENINFSKHVTVFIKEEILNIVDNSRVSTRKIARTINLSRSTVWQILKADALHLFIFNVCIFLQKTITLIECVFDNGQSPKFLAKILFSDEAIFSEQNILNIHGRYVPQRRFF